MLAIAPTFDGRRTIPSPEVTRLMLDLLSLTSKDKVLEIGTGSGYQTKALAETGAEIHSIELEPWIQPSQLEGCSNVYLHSGNGKIGLEAEAPFTAILATCGVEEIPKPWIAQLADGGRLVLPIGTREGQRLSLIRKELGSFNYQRVAAYVRFQMLREAD